MRSCRIYSPKIASHLTPPWEDSAETSRGWPTWGYLRRATRLALRYPGPQHNPLFGSAPPPIRNLGLNVFPTPIVRCPGFNLLAAPPQPGWWVPGGVPKHQHLTTVVCCCSLCELCITCWSPRFESVATTPEHVFPKSTSRGEFRAGCTKTRRNPRVPAVLVVWLWWLQKLEVCTFRFLCRPHE